jgi:16S rRNA (cytosine1402-N4)-methyltransferase
MKVYHIPVMINECVEGLNIKSDGIYVDATFGGGGHSREIIKHVETGLLFGVDQDADAGINAEGLNDGRFTFIEANFRHLSRYLKLAGIESIDGLLADLGVSSHQINEPDRGFSTRFDGKLDMRMDRNQELTAEKVINYYPGRDLQEVLGKYGEIRNARTLAEHIIRARIDAPVRTTGELVNILKRFVPPNRQNKYFAQVFQALRIEVNDELGALRDLLEQSADLLNKEGRLVIMAYHSLEDRLIKNFIKTGDFGGNEIKDIYGHSIKPFKAINRKPIMASLQEIKGNNRARSARLRIAEKI